MSRVATTADEILAFIPAEDAQLFGVLTKPTVEPNGLCVIILLGGIFNLSVNRNRLTVRIARRLASQGYHVLRLDQHGVGESSGTVTESRLDKPWVEDVTAAIRWLEARGLDRFVLLGQCFGARSLLAATPFIKNLHGMAMVSTPILDYNTHAELAVAHRAHLPTKKFLRKAFSASVLRKIFASRHRKRYASMLKVKLRKSVGGARAAAEERASPQYLEYISKLIDRGVPTLLAFGTEELAGDFDRAKAGELGKILARGRSVVQEHRFDHWAHGFPSLAVQDETVALVEDWLARVVAPTAPSAVREPEPNTAGRS